MIDVLILGAGPSGLYAADRLSSKGFSVCIADRMPSPARKFLMAGRGGLNLTHSEDLDLFKTRYGEAEPFIGPLIDAFPPEQLRAWCHVLGEETFVGSSGRIFPKSMKASPLLRALLRRLERQNVTLKSRLTWTGFSKDRASLFRDGKGETQEIAARTTLLAFGGASWPRLGSDASWVAETEKCGINIRPFKPANCGFHVDWSQHLIGRFAGTPLKRIKLHFGDKSVRGEALVSEKGLEGGAVYALSSPVRDALETSDKVNLRLDLTPQFTLEKLQQRLAKPRGKQSFSNFLRKAAGLAPVEIALLREAGPLAENTNEVAQRIKSLNLTVREPFGIDRAISSAGGISLKELTPEMMLAKLPGVFAAGEMLDWEAPTGGYLLQACFSMAHRASGGIAQYLENSNTEGMP